MLSSLLLLLIQAAPAAAEDSAPKPAPKPLYLRLTEGRQQKGDQAQVERKISELTGQVNQFNSALGTTNGAQQAGGGSLAPASSSNGSSATSSTAPATARVPAFESMRAPASLPAGFDRKLTPEEEAAMLKLQEQTKKLQEALSNSLQEP